MLILQILSGNDYFDNLHLLGNTDVYLWILIELQQTMLDLHRYELNATTQTY